MSMPTSGSFAACNIPPPLRTNRGSDNSGGGNNSVTTQSAITTQVIAVMLSRLQQSCINDQIDGRLLGYVDDFCGCSSTSFADADQDIVNKIGERFTQSAEDRDYSNNTSSSSGSDSNNSSGSNNLSSSNNSGSCSDNAIGSDNSSDSSGVLQTTKSCINDQINGRN
jgi:hypothetical protein